MKYYSEKTKKVYDTIDLLKAAEKELSDKLNAEKTAEQERKTFANTIEMALEAYLKNHNERVAADEKELDKIKNMSQEYVAKYGMEGFVELTRKLLQIN